MNTQLKVVLSTLAWLALPTARMAVGESPQLVRNGSFEEVVAGMVPPLPTGWLLERWSQADEVTVVSDAAIAHRGRRCLRIVAPGTHGLRMHSVRPGGIRLKAGTKYTIRLWARRAAKVRATVTVEPGGGRFQLSDSWQRYSVAYEHPANGAAAMGLFVAIQGGPAYLDDVSMAEASPAEPVPPELKRTWQRLKNAPLHRTWTLPSWQERIPIVLREVVGKQALHFPVRLQMGQLLRTYRFDFIDRDTIRVVDPSIEGGKEVPAAIINADRNPGLSTRDQLIFLANCPPRTRKTYYIYVRNRRPKQLPFVPPQKLPANVKVAADYAHRLAVDVNKTERLHSLRVRMVRGRPVADIRSGTAQKVRARLVAPNGRRKIDLPLERNESGNWTTAHDFQLTSKLVEGVWRLDAVLQERSGTKHSLSAAFVVGHGMWAQTIARRIYPDSTPAGANHGFRLFAAGNEWESFQLAIATARGLRGVSLRATDLKQRRGSGKIKAGSITIESVEHTYGAYGFRSGSIPDPLLPWRKQNVQAGTHHVALVTVRVPAQAPAGVYAGQLVATSDDGVTLKMPLELEVFGFSLPARRSFTPVLSADIGSVNKDATGKLKKSNGQFRYSRPFPMSRRRTAMESARFLGERHITPMYYSQHNGPYATPWLWDAQTRQMDVDFSRMDEALSNFKQLDIKYLFIGSNHRPRLNRGAIYSKDPRTNKYVYGWHGTRTGEAMMRAWLRPVYNHLKKKGWADRTIIYINDELWHKRTTDGQSLNKLMENYGRLIHRVAPKFRTFVADNARSDWFSVMDEMDIFTGLIRNDTLQRLKQQGGQWWGVYNRSLYLHKPLGNARILGLDSYFRGWSHYFHVDITRWGSDPWVNPRRYARAGGKNNFFVSGSGPDGFDMMLYPWPSWTHRRWKPGSPTVCSSLRLEAIRESIDDYEYLQMLSDSEKSLPAGSAVKRKCRILLQRARSFVADCNTKSDWRYGGSHSEFLINGNELQKLRRDIGRALTQANKSK